MLPLAPGTLSTTTGCPHRAVSFSARARVSLSALPPAATGTTMCTGRFGKAAGSAAAAAALRPRAVSRIKGVRSRLRRGRVGVACMVAATLGRPGGAVNEVLRLTICAQGAHMVSRNHSLGWPAGAFSLVRPQPCVALHPTLQLNLYLKDPSHEPDRPQPRFQRQ